MFPRTQPQFFTYFTTFACNFSTVIFLLLISNFWISWNLKIWKINVCFPWQWKYKIFWSYRLHAMTITSQSPIPSTHDLMWGHSRMVLLSCIVYWKWAIHVHCETLLKVSSFLVQKLKIMYLYLYHQPTPAMIGQLPWNQSEESDITSPIPECENNEQCQMSV